MSVVFQVSMWQVTESNLESILKLRSSVRFLFYQHGTLFLLILWLFFFLIWMQHLPIVIFLFLFCFSEMLLTLPFLLTNFFYKCRWRNDCLPLAYHELPKFPTLFLIFYAQAYLTSDTNYCRTIYRFKNSKLNLSKCLFWKSYGKHEIWVKNDLKTVYLG